MTGRTARYLAITLALLSALCAPLMAQSQAPAAPANPPSLLPGLDPRLIDTTADPCVDFAQYACGNFNKLYPIPNDRSGYGTGSMVAEYTENVLHTMLEAAAAGGAKRTPNERKIGDFYASCIATDAIDQDGLKPLQPELARIATLSGKDELPELFAHYQLINDTAWFNFGEQQDFKDARRQIAVVDQGGLGLPERDFYFRTGAVAEKTRTQYVQHITNILKLMGEPEPKAVSDAQKIMQMETALAKVSMDVTSQRDPNNVYHLMPVSQLATLAPAIDWERFLKGTGVPPVSELNVANPDFFKGMNALLVSTDLDTVKTYLRWQLIHNTDSLVLPQPFDDEVFDFYRRKLRGQPEQRARWKRCVQATDGALGDALGQVYVAQEFPPSSKQATVQMVHDIEAAMDQDLSTLDWMSAATKTRAKEKLHAVADKIGYPDHWRDYSSLEVKPNDYAGNVLRAYRFNQAYEWNKLGKPVNRDEWGMTPPTVNAYFDPQMNDINFPAGVLQPPLYDPKLDDAPNYGNTGATIGHELTHAFDDEGRQFDSKGNLRDWWTPEDAKGFEQRIGCVRTQYAGYIVVDDIHINSKLTSGEDVADLGGTLLAYMAWKKETAGEQMPNKDGFTPDQRFFVGMAQWACSNERPEDERVRAATDEHSPSFARINGVVSNLPEFQKAFACKAGQPMVHVPNCKVW